jgi:hypothetical protein
MSETSVILSNVDNLRINDAIARWVGKKWDKPDINVMVGSATVVPRKSRTCSDVCESSVLTYQESFVFLARILIANALLFMTISMLLMIISRIMNTKLFSIFKRRTKSHDLYVRNVGGQMYVRRSVLVYMVTGLPVLSVIILLQMSH